MYSFINIFLRKRGLIFHANHLPADESHDSYVFLKKQTNKQTNKTITKQNVPEPAVTGLLTHCRLNELSYTVYWKILEGMSGCYLDIPREKWLTICK